MKLLVLLCEVAGVSSSASGPSGTNPHLHFHYHGRATSLARNTTGIIDMLTVETEVTINANPQTVWAVLDDLPRYGEWNPIIPHLAGRTTLGQVVVGELVIPNLPTPPLTPTINRVVAVREFRWITDVPGEFSAEHIFELHPTSDGTHLIHREVFGGPAAEHMADAIRTLIKPAYEGFDQAIKARAEQFATATPFLHASVDAEPTSDALTSVTLRCLCPSDQVEVSVNAPIAHDHLCGCSKCWKPEGSLLARTAVAASDTVKVTAQYDKLATVDPSQAIIRYACKDCGAHMVGTVADPNHHFYGLTFVHPELADLPGRPEFAGFLSSLIESGTPAAMMGSIRSALSGAGIQPYDAFSPEIMDVIGYHRIKLVQAV